MTRTILSSTAMTLVLSVATPGFAATIIGGSDLLSPTHATTIEDWLVNDPTLSYSGPLGFTNIFDKATGDNSTDFHTAVNGKGPTFFVAEATDSRGGGTQIIGGFNPQSWNAIYSYNITPNAADRTAFIFNLTSGLRMDQETNTGSGQYQTYNGGVYGPTFGGGHDIYVNNTLSTGYAQSYSYCADPLHDCYDYYGDANIMGLRYAGNTVSFGAIEVFTITDDVSAVPLPAGLPLMLGALAGLGAVSRRKSSPRKDT